MIKLYFVLISLLIFSACTERCVYNSQCTNDELCREGSCLKTCLSYKSCAEGEACVDGACQKASQGYCEDQKSRPSDSGLLACEPEDSMIKEDQSLEDQGIDFKLKDMKIPIDMDDYALTDQALDATMRDLLLTDAEGLDQGDLEIAVVDQMLWEMSVSSMEMNVLMDQTMPDQSIDMMVRPRSNTEWLYTEGNRIFKPGRTPWMARGVNIHDTRSCNACSWTAPNVNEVLRRIDEAVNIWGAKLLRLNLESYIAGNGRVQWQGISQDPSYLADIERIVHYVGSQYTGVYLMLVPWEEPSMTENGWPSDDTRRILSRLVDSFYDAPQVIFAVSHEPKQNIDGSLDAQCWNEMNQAVTSIRDQERQLGPYRHLVAVQGCRSQARDVSYYIDHPIVAGNGENILYEAHIYQSAVDFNRTLGNAMMALPMIIGSFGPNSNPSDLMTIEDAQALIQLLEQNQVPWTAWSFHMRCRSTTLLVDQTEGGCGLNMPLIPTAWGQIIQGVLQQHR
jgi:hypothetical protein